MSVADPGGVSGGSRQGIREGIDEGALLSTQKTD